MAVAGEAPGGPLPGRPAPSGSLHRDVAAASPEALPGAEARLPTPGAASGTVASGLF
jgi:hypothetical protein